MVLVNHPSLLRISPSVFLPQSALLLHENVRNLIIRTRSHLRDELINYVVLPESDKHQIRDF